MIEKKNENMDVENVEGEVVHLLNINIGEGGDIKFEEKIVEKQEEKGEL